MNIKQLISIGVALIIAAPWQAALALDQRDMVGHLRGRYNLAFY